jgi:hypothetical protein
MATRRRSDQKGIARSGSKELEKEQAAALKKQQEEELRQQREKEELEHTQTCSFITKINLSKARELSRIFFHI